MIGKDSWAYNIEIEEAMRNIYDVLGENIADELYEEATHRTAMATFPCINCGHDAIVILGTPYTCQCGTIFNIDMNIYRVRNT